MARGVIYRLFLTFVLRRSTSEKIERGRLELSRPLESSESFPRESGERVGALKIRTRNCRILTQRTCEAVTSARTALRVGRSRAAVNSSDRRATDSLCARRSPSPFERRVWHLPCRSGRSFASSRHCRRPARRRRWFSATWLENVTVPRSARRRSQESRPVSAAAVCPGFSFSASEAAPE